MNNIFDSKPIILNKENINTVEEEDSKPYLEKGLSANQIKDREEKTIFIGNLNIKSEKKDIIKAFKHCGAIDKIWIRSVPVKIDSKIPKKGRIIKKEYNENNDNKNCYILFKELSSIEKALEMNSTKFMDFTLRVNLANQKRKDYKKTIFVGNLPFVIKEEELRTNFVNCGEIENIRIIRDKQSFKCKGFGYITFKDKLSYYNGLKKDGELFNGRNLRISKAVPESKLVTEHGTNFQKVIRKKKKITTQEDYELLGKIKKVGIENDTISNAQINDMYSHKPKVPQNIINKKIKKIKKNADSKEDFFRKTNNLKKVEGDKFNKAHLETGNLLAERRKLRKNKAESNRKYFSHKNMLKKHN